MSDNSGMNVLGAIILGAAVGAATALMMAPDTGKRTRKKMNRKMRDINDKLEDVVERSRKGISDLSADAEDNLKELSKMSKKIIGG